MSGDYISREAAYNAIVNNYDTDDQLRDLDAIPAADVVEVRHGLWIPVKGYTGVEAFGFKEEAVENLRCSVCGKEIDVSEGWAIYCPSCGAKMDGGQEE